MAVLVLNLGSSSVKYALFSGEQPRARGIAERLGSAEAQLVPEGGAARPLPGADHAAGLDAVIEALTHPTHGALGSLAELHAVGHRVVHGGPHFDAATLIDDEVKQTLRELCPLAPLHNPVNLAGIELCEALLPGVPQVAVFDTAFHATMPEHISRYALPEGLIDDHELRRFGFHGTSHGSACRAAAALLDVELEAHKIVCCHLGNGASVTAVAGGRALDTSMGLTPLEGLIMGTRAGDLDPGLLLHLMAHGHTPEQLDGLLNERSGLLGLSGLSGDMRTLQRAADKGHEGATLAIRAFCYRVRKYIGAYAAAMGGLDALIFTGGVGENATAVREQICRKLGFLGVQLDAARNEAPGDGERIVSAPGRGVAVLVIPADEEAAIAAETRAALTEPKNLTERFDRSVKPCYT